MSTAKLWRHRTDFQGYVPLHSVEIAATAISIDRLREYDVTRPMVGDCRQSFLRINSRLKRKILGEIRTAVPLWTKFLRSERSTTELAGPGCFQKLFKRKVLSHCISADWCFYPLKSLTKLNFFQLCFKLNNSLILEQIKRLIFR